MALEPRNPRWDSRRARFLCEAGQWAAALEPLRQALGGASFAGNDPLFIELAALEARALREAAVPDSDLRWVMHWGHRSEHEVQRDRLDDAATSAARAMAFAEAGDARARLYATMATAKVDLARGRVVASRRRYVEALDLARSLTAESFRIGILRELSDCAYRRDDHERALALALEAVRAQEALGRRPILRICVVSPLVELGRLDEAERLLHQQLAEAGGYGAFLTGASHSWFGVIELRRRRPDRVRAHYAHVVRWELDGYGRSFHGRWGLAHAAALEGAWAEVAQRCGALLDPGLDQVDGPIRQVAWLSALYIEALARVGDWSSVDAELVAFTGRWTGTDFVVPEIHDHLAAAGRLADAAGPPALAERVLALATEVERRHAQARREDAKLGDEI